MHATDIVLVFATLGVVAAMGIPSWGDHSMRGRRADALKALKTVGELQADFYAEHDRYSDSLSELGFDPEGRAGGRAGFGEPGRVSNGLLGGAYRYALTTWVFEGNPHGNFRVTATANLDLDDEVLDIIIIENELGLDGRTVDANTSVILSDDLSKATTRVVSRFGGGASGYRYAVANTGD